MKPTHFRNAAALRAWLRANHKTAREIELQLMKKHAADQGVTYPEALDEALCYGWIDGVRRRYDADSYTQRFTPRRPNSVWSAVNIRHVQRLIEKRRMTKAGLAEFEKRDRIVSYDRPAPPLQPADEARFRRNPAAWKYFSASSPGYRRNMLLWLADAKRDDTRQKRLDVLIESSAKGLPIPPLRRPTEEQ